MKSKAFGLREIEIKVDVPLTTLGYRDFTSNMDWYHNLISFTSLLKMPSRNSILCGLTSFDTDLMYEFFPEDEKFDCLNFTDISEKFEVKIHRSLHLLSDGRVVGATACLHREDQRREASGGRIFIYDPEKKEYDILGTPVKHDYIQTITVDEGRGLIYGSMYPILNFFIFDIEKRKTIRTDFMGSIPHIVALDDRGHYWSTWNNRTHNLFRYDPDSDKIDFYDHNLPHTNDSCNLMYPGAGPIDGMVKGNDGCLYIGEAYGNLDRLDPKTGKVENLGKPLPSETRIPALEVGPDGKIYGIAGFLGRCHIFSFDTERDSFEVFGHIKDEASGEPLFIGHDMCFYDRNTVFVGETDTAHRAGYLWRCTL